MIKTPAIGVPTTVLEIAAIPQIIKPGPIARPTVVPPIIVANFVNNAPAVAPINNAEKKFHQTFPNQYKHWL